MSVVTNLYVVFLNDHKPLEALSLADKALDVWEQFFQKHGL